MAQTYAPYSQSHVPLKPLQQNYQPTNHYDNSQANVPQTEVTATSPSMPSAPHGYYIYGPAKSSDGSYGSQTQYGYTQQSSQIPDDSHMSSYVPNVASRFPHSSNHSQIVPSYANGIAPGQSWARPADSQMNYPPPTESSQSPAVVGQQAFGHNDHPGQGATHFDATPQPESNVKVEPATQGSDFGVGHESFSQASQGNAPAAYNHPNHGYGHGYDASIQQQPQHQAFHGYTPYFGAPHDSQQQFYAPNHHGHVYNSYQSYQPSQQQQYPAPPSNNYAPHQPTYGLYDPHHHHENRQLAQEAPYEDYEEPLMKDVEGGELMLNTPPEFVRPSALEGQSAATPQQVGNHDSPDVATSTREVGYGQASHDDNHQAGHAHDGFTQHQHAHHQASHSHTSSSVDAQSSPYASPAPKLRYPDGSPTPDLEESSERKISPEELAQRSQTVSYQRHLQERQFKRQRSAQFEEFEANHRPRLNSYQLDADYAYSVAQNNIPHHHHPAHHHRQASSSSSHSDQSNRMPVAVPPVVPSQAYERPMPVPLIPSLEPEKKDPPPKKPALACLFCRKRKIACGPPPPDRQDKTCNQCVRRKQPCEYPTESRRGIRKTPKDNVIEEPTVHKFVHGDPSSHDGSAAGRGKGRRKRSLDE